VDTFFFRAVFSSLSIMGNCDCARSFSHSIVFFFQVFFAWLLLSKTFSPSFQDSLDRSKELSLLLLFLGMSWLDFACLFFGFPWIEHNLHPFFFFFFELFRICFFFFPFAIKTKTVVKSPVGPLRPFCIHYVIFPLYFRPSYYLRIFYPL